MAQALESLVRRLEAAVGRLEALESRIGVKSSIHGEAVVNAGLNRELESAGSPSVAAFEDLVAGSVGRVMVAAEKIGGPVFEASKLIKEAFEEEKKIVRAISQCKQPDMADLQKLVQPLALLLMKANSMTEGRRTDAFNHNKVIAEGLQALSWVVYTKESGMSKPTAQVEESWQSAEFYNNKVLIEFRTKNPDQCEWAKAIKELFFPGLRDYVKKFHATGPAWNPNGIDLKRFMLGAASPQAPKAPVPPPPPPGPPAPPPPAPPGSSAAAAAGPSKPSMNAVFQDINKGGAVTAGLKKVTNDMKSKNRADRSGLVQTSEKEKASSDQDTRPVATKAAPPVFELQMDRKWVVENQVDNRELIISDGNARQSVYIFGCKGSIIQIQGKVNNITFDKCSKTGLVFRDVVAACEVVNCSSVEIHCQGTAPTIALDNTNGCQLYLSQESLKACITTAKSTGINVLVPGDNDYVEHALPEQFVNTYEDGRFVTTPVSHHGG